MTSTNPDTDDQTFFNQEMQEEFFVSLARKEAYRLIRKQDLYNTRVLLEDHIKEKYKLNRSAS